MRKKVLSLCMALALCLSLLPVTALAAAPDGQLIYVGNVDVTSGGYWTTSDDGMTLTPAASVTDSDSYIHYDTDTNTLTLHDATIKTSNNHVNVVGSAIGVFNGSGDVDLTIQLEGDNTIENVSMGIYVYSYSVGTATLTITGNGSLNASGNQTGILVHSTSGNATLTIENAKVEATGTSGAGNGVNVRSLSSSTASLTVDGGSLTASGSPGILYDSSGGDSAPNTVLSISDSAFVDARDGKIGAGSTTALTEVSPTDNSVGIVFDGDDGTVYGSVTLQENLTIENGQTLTIPDGASLTIDSGATLTNEGTVTNNGTLTNNGTINNSGTLPDDIGGTAPPSITTTALDDGNVNTSYSETLNADGSPTSWEVTDGSLPAGLTLDESTGVISGTPTADGTFSFTVTATNDYGSDSKEFTLTIDQQDTIHVTSVSLDKTSLELTEGETAQLTATVLPDNASNKNVTWESSNTNVATVDANGEVTAVSAGTATITVTTADGGKTATCEVTVTAQTYNISVTPATLNFGSLNAGYAAPPAAQTVSITNTGNQTITLTQPTATNFDIGTLSATELAAGATATFTVQPKTGLAAGNYNETLAISGDNDAGATVGLSFTVNPKLYTVTVLTDGKGSASASPATAEAGTTVTLTADPDNGYRLARWDVVEGDVTISGNSFTMPDKNVTVRAVFSPVVSIPDTHEIELIVGEGGEARLSLTNASEGSTITVTATPDAGYELDYITVGGERIDGTTFTMPNHDVTVRVYFTDGAALPFTDVSAGAWYFDAVSYVYVGGLMDGVSDTLFDPDGTMTRAMVWAILARVDGETVTGEDWIETAREWAVAEGVSDGENATDYVTREQLATMLWRYASGKGYDVSIGEDTNILSYADFADLSEYAIPAMQWACGAGVITGVTDATLVPQGEATRAQVAAMLMRFVDSIG